MTCTFGEGDAPSPSFRTLVSMGKDESVDDQSEHSVKFISERRPLFREGFGQQLDLLISLTWMQDSL